MTSGDLRKSKHFRCSGACLGGVDMVILMSSVFWVTQNGVDYSFKRLNRFALILRQSGGILLNEADGKSGVECELLMNY